MAWVLESEQAQRASTVMRKHAHLVLLAFSTAFFVLLAVPALVMTLGWDTSAMSLVERSRHLQAAQILWYAGSIPAGLLLLGAFIRWQLVRRRPAWRECERCGYRNAGWSTTRCPECGAVADVGNSQATRDRAGATVT